MAETHGYVSTTDTGSRSITVADLRRVLDAADPDGLVELVPKINDGTAVPIHAAMANLEDPDAGNVLLYLDHPGK